MSLPASYTPGHYYPVRVFASDTNVDTCFAVRAPGGQLVGKPDTYTTRAAAKARAQSLNDIRHAMAPRKAKS
jgi:hypothetical protein